MQELLICNTYKDNSMKSEIDGWSYYNPSAISEAKRKYPDKDVWHDPSEKWRIGSIGVPNGGYPITPWHALALGWKLLSTPQECTDPDGNLVYTWWFVREEQ